MKSIMAMYHYYFLKTVIYWQLICRICRGIVHSLDIRLWRWMEIDIWSCGDLSYRNCAQDIGVIFHIFIDQNFSTLSNTLLQSKMIKNIYAMWSKLLWYFNLKKYLLWNCGRYKNSVSSENAALQVCIIKCPVIKY